MSLSVMKLDESELWAKFRIEVEFKSYGDVEKESSIFSICNSSAKFAVKIKGHMKNQNREYICVTQCYLQINAEDNLLFKIVSPHFPQNDRLKLFSSGPHFHCITKIELQDDYFKPRSYELNVNLVNQTNLPDKLFEDSEFTDFELQGEDGSVCVHKNVLAASSPVLRTMLLGEWRETREGRVNLPSISKVTLDHFKDYLYKRKIPEDALACFKLLPLAEYYMMPDLKTDCALKISTESEPELAWECLEYCFQHKHYDLFLTILENTCMKKLRECVLNIYRKMKESHKNI